MNRKLGKTTIILLISLASIWLTSHARGSAVERSVVLSLGTGEMVMWAESHVFLSAAKDDIILIVGKGEKGPFYAYRNGKKSGPFSGIDDAMSEAFEDRQELSSRGRDCAVYDPDPPPADAEPMISEGDDGGQTLEYTGKTFGPHLLIGTTTITPDGSRLYYTATDKDKAWFGCADGRRISFKGVPSDFKFSPDGKKAAVLAEGTVTTAEMEDMGSLPPEKLDAMIKEMDQRFLYTIDGKKFGPFPSQFGRNDFWFPAGSNDLYFMLDGQIYRNGQPFLKSKSIDPCAFYPGPDGKSYAYIDYEKIVFSDGQKYASPLELSVFAENGKTVFKWLVLENDKDLVVCRKAM